MKIFFIGDIMGSPGRDLFEHFLPRIKKEFSPDFLILNGENTAAGRGITPKIAQTFFDLGVDCITSGNHIWDQRGIGTYLESENRLLRPANYPSKAQGFGMVKLQKGEHRLAVINLQGRAFMPPIDCPFQKVDQILQELSDWPVFVDFHAEATAEKKMMSYWLDGRVMALVGTHTHVPTADSCLLPNGTAYQTDVGMTGSKHSSIGLTFDSVVNRLVYQLPTKFEVAHQDLWLCGVYIEGDGELGLATHINSVQWHDDR